jgi:hypothetical protein
MNYLHVFLGYLLTVSTEEFINIRMVNKKTAVVTGMLGYGNIP